MDSKQEKRSYSFYKVIKWESYTQPVALDMKIYPSEYPSSATKIEEVPKNNTPYLEYKISFDEKMNRGGYTSVFSETTQLYEPHSFDFYFRKNTFTGYFFKEKGYILFNTSYKIADSFLKSLGGLISRNGTTPKSLSEDTILLQKIEFEPLDVAKKVEVIYGAWWRIDNTAYLSAQATFGKKVDNSGVYQQLEKAGNKITSLNFPLNHHQKDFSLIISRNGSIAILNNSTKIESISLARHIMDTLIINV